MATGENFMDKLSLGAPSSKANVSDIDRRRFSKRRLVQRLASRAHFPRPMSTHSPG